MLHGILDKMEVLVLVETVTKLHLMRVMVQLVAVVAVTTAAELAVTV